jgi:hypothetical protein
MILSSMIIVLKLFPKVFAVNYFIVSRIFVNSIILFLISIFDDIIYNFIYIILYIIYISTNDKSIILKILYTR